MEQKKKNQKQQEEKKKSKNKMSVPRKKNNNNKKKGETKKNREMDRSGDENESEELVTDESPIPPNVKEEFRVATKEEEEEEEVEEQVREPNVVSEMRERRPSNLVRLDTKTDWSKDQLDSMQQEMLDQLKLLAVNNEEGASVDLLNHFNMEQDDTQTEDNQSPMKFDRLTDDSPMQTTLVNDSTKKPEVTTMGNLKNEETKGLITSKREQELLAQIEYLTKQNDQLKAQLVTKELEIKSGRTAHSPFNVTQGTKRSGVEDNEIGINPNPFASQHSEKKEPLIYKENEESNQKSCPNTCSCCVL